MFPDVEYLDDCRASIDSEQLSLILVGEHRGAIIRECVCVEDSNFYRNSVIVHSSHTLFSIASGCGVLYVEFHSLHGVIWRE